jgi:hypothetical protein
MCGRKLIHESVRNRDCRVEMKVIVFLISVLISFNVLSETYVCSEELSKYGRPGQIETLKFERMGNVFKSGPFTYQIPHDSKSFLILTRLDTLNPPSLTTVFIDKDTKEWGMGYFTMDEFKKSPPDPLSYGKCVIVN